MGRLTVLALRTVLVAGIAGTLFVQAVIVPLLAVDLDEVDAPSGIRVPILVIVVLGIVTIQVVMLCVWRLLTMVRAGTVFSVGAFRYVHIVIGALSSAAVLTFAFAVTLAIANRSTPGDVVAPGLIGMICGASMLIGGIALVVLILRMLLAQAVDRDAEAHQMRAELDEVI